MYNFGPVTEKIKVTLLSRDYGMSDGEGGGAWRCLLDQDCSVLILAIVRWTLGVLFLYYIVIYFLIYLSYAPWSAWHGVYLVLYTSMKF